jgi:hypothetical protein
MVPADTDIGTGVPLRAALPHDDVPGETSFAAEQLHAEALANRIAPVARRSACFFVRHDLSPFCLLKIHLRDLMTIRRMRRSMTKT